MRLQYTGPFDAVRVGEIYDPETGISIEIERGEPVDVPDDVAERLLEQRANWRRAGRGQVRDYAAIAADVAALEAREAAGDEPPTDAPSDTGANTDEG